MFRAPANRCMQVLDRSLFTKRISLAAARIFDNKNISRYRTELTKSKDILQQPRLPNVRPDGGEGGDPTRKCVLLKPEVKHDDESTWSPKIKELLETKQISLRPYDLVLDYDYWTYHDIISAILPEDRRDEIPSGYSQAGHIAHFNLREQYLPYKHLIATVVRDKNANIKTVINKVEDVGVASEYRTFTPEILDGIPDLNCAARESDCEFRFNYAEVYWNSRLSTEHARMIGKFQKGEAVCDAMAGVGPFAIPAGKKRVFVWANDLNPIAYKSLTDAIHHNKVGEFVTASNQDARKFIESATTELRQAIPRRVAITEKSHRGPKTPGDHHRRGRRIVEDIYQPQTFAHYVMNLPASAITFLDSFVGLYAGQEHMFEPRTDTKLPWIHSYCFSTKSDDDVEEKIKICEEISSRIGWVIRPEHEGVDIVNVRKVAPNKTMFCASFRLPREVAFRT